MSSNGNKSTVHHLIPRSRGGDSSKANLKRVPWRIHDAWHTLFFNLLPEEICAQVLLMSDELFNTAHKQMAWQTVFNCRWQEAQLGLTQEDIIGQIIDNWLPRGYIISWELINERIWEICCGKCPKFFCALTHKQNYNNNPFEYGQTFSYCYKSVRVSMVEKFFI